MENVLNLKQSQKQTLLQQMMKEVCSVFLSDVLLLWLTLTGKKNTMYMMLAVQAPDCLASLLTPVCDISV